MEIGQGQSLIQSKTKMSKCQNCQKIISIDKLYTHQPYCLKNFQKCQMCGQVINKQQFQHHLKEQHSNKSCTYCHDNFIGRQLIMHQENCYAKPISCKYCQKLCPKGHYQNHIKTCQMRIKNCILCKNTVHFSEYENHLKICQVKKIQRQRKQNSQESKPQPKSNNQQDGRYGSRMKSQKNMLLIPKIQQKKQQDKKTHKIKPVNFIKHQPIIHQISPIPLSIQMALKIKQQKMQHNIK